jgi:outer membrane receptor for monomeric catechols
MSEPAILFMKPSAISADDKLELKNAGILVIEIDDPANAKFTRAAADISSTDMLGIAATIIKNTPAASVRDSFAKAVCIAIEQAHEQSKRGPCK